MNITKKIAQIIVLIGAFNWGLYGLVSIDLVHALFGFVPMLARIVYVLVGLSALYLVLEKISSKKSCSCCDTCPCNDPEVKAVNNVESKIE